MRLRDTPTVEVTRRLACSPERAWELVTDIELPPAPRANCNGPSGSTAPPVSPSAPDSAGTTPVQMGEWHTEPEVVEVEDGRRWVWRVGPADAPIALWGFEVDTDREGVVVRQWAKMCDGRSPLSEFIAQHPDKEGRIVEHRLSVWHTAMTANLATIEEFAADPA